MPDAFICDYVRTPIGRFGGTLSQVRTDDLAAIPLKALAERHKDIDFEAIDDVIFGCANQAGEDNRNVARMALLLAGFPVSVTGSTINRLCGSGMDAVLAAARAIRAGEADLMIAGGVESMSRAPFVMPKATAAFSRNAEIYDTTIGWRFVNPLLKKMYGVDSMPETGENVAADYQVSRADQDAFALRSQARASAAQKNGRLAREIAPVVIPQRKGEALVIDRDEHPRETSLEALAKLPTPFRDGGTVTAGNASGVNDGAAALIIASEAAVKKHGLTPIARVVSGATAGVPPRVMGMGPAPATTKLLARTGKKIGDVGLRQPGARGAPRARRPRRCRACQSEWRRHRARPSARRLRRPHRRLRRAGTEGEGRPYCCGHHVHRRRSGNRRNAGNSLIKAVN
jgi:acetyl-CoA acyltransferase